MTNNNYDDTISLEDLISTKEVYCPVCETNICITSDGNLTYPCSDPSCPNEGYALEDYSGELFFDD